VIVPGVGVPKDIVGFRALGRHGDLGVVVEVREETADGSHVIVVRGGVSKGLIYFVPIDRVRRLSQEGRTVLLDMDLTDFVPRLHEDGTVELRSVP